MIVAVCQFSGNFFSFHSLLKISNNSEIDSIGRFDSIILFILSGPAAVFLSSDKQVLISLMVNI